MHFQDFRQLNQQIIRIGLKIGFYRGRLFQRKDIQKSHAKKLIYTCKQKNCSAKLIYLWTGSQSPISCEFFDNMHFHKKSSNIQKLKRQLIQQFILELPFSQSFQNPKKFQYRFDISQKQAKYIVQQLYWYNNTENEIFSKMAFQGKTLRRIRDNMGNLIAGFIGTDSMRKNYCKYGQVINFDVSHRMIKKRSAYGINYAVGYFMAQDTNLRLVLTGICFFIRDQQQLIKQMFKFYFQLMCQNQLPRVIFTQDTPCITNALIQLKKQNENFYNFLHFFDWYHLCSNLRDSLDGQTNGRQIFQLFCRALGQSSVSVYENILSQIKPLLNQQQILGNFINKEQQHSLCKMPPSPINFGIQYRYSRKLSQRINQCTVFETFTGRFFFTLLHFQKILQRVLQKVTVINQGLIKHVQYQQIHMLTQKVQNLVMQQLFTFFKQSLDQDLLLIKLKQENPLEYVVVSKKSESSENLSSAKPRYYLSFLLNYGHWHCTCNMQYRLGLPCLHIIKILRQVANGALQYYINTRWIHSKQDRIPQFSKPLISRKLRRV